MKCAQLDGAVPGPCFDFWICQGRLCRSQGADRLQQAIDHAVSSDGTNQVRVLRGGCYGLCELSANVVVRRWENADDLPETTTDRLRLSEQENETVYCQVELEHVPQILKAHLQHDKALVSLTRETRESSHQAPNSTAEKIRSLRQKKGPEPQSR